MLQIVIPVWRVVLYYRGPWHGSHSVSRSLRLLCDLNVYVSLRVLVAKDARHDVVRLHCFFFKTCGCVALFYALVYMAIMRVRAATATYIVALLRCVSQQSAKLLATRGCAKHNAINCIVSQLHVNVAYRLNSENATQILIGFIASQSWGWSPEKPGMLLFLGIAWAQVDRKRN